MLGYILQRHYNGKAKTYETQKLIATAKNMGITLELHDPSEFDILVSKDYRKSILLNQISTPLPDFILPRMGATTAYAAFAVLRHFERLGVYCANPSNSIETVKDKLFQMQILAEQNIPVPKTYLAKFPVDVDFIQTQFGFPVVVKLLSGTQGNGVYLAHDYDNFEDVMKMLELSNREAHLIIQEYISSSRGRDLRVYVVGNKVMGCMQRKANDGGFKANFSRGGKVEAYSLPKEIEEMCVKISKIFNLEIAGIDLLFDKNNNFKVCEVNSSPGFKGLESAIQKDIAQEIISYIQSKVEKR